MNILMVNLPFAGHTNPTIPLTVKLVDCVHKVIYVNAPEFREKIECTGATFVPYKDFLEKTSKNYENYKKQHSFVAAFDTVVDLAKKLEILCVRQFSQPAWNENTWVGEIEKLLVNN